MGAFQTVKPMRNDLPHALLLRSGHYVIPDGGDGAFHSLPIFRASCLPPIHLLARNSLIGKQAKGAFNAVLAVTERAIDECTGGDKHRRAHAGRLVIDEDYGKPYWDNRYTEKFKKVRNAAGVPSNVWSMDSRAGAVSETVKATGSLEAARDLATHTTTKTTRRYSRGDGLETSRKIAEAREKNRT